jgi:hypothetical protein
MAVLADGSVQIFPDHTAGNLDVGFDELARPPHPAII